MTTDGQATLKTLLLLLLINIIIITIKVIYCIIAWPTTSRNGQALRSQ